MFKNFWYAVEFSHDVVATFMAAHLAGSPSAKSQLEQLAEQPQPEIAAVRRR